MTMKKKYTAPQTTERALVFETHLLSGSGLRATFALGRESKTWDEEEVEEEENTGGWFQ